MTSGTVSTTIQTFSNKKECIVLNVTDDSVYGSKKFANIEAAEVSLNGTTGTVMSVSFTGGTVKFHGLNSEDSANVTLTLYGT